MNIQNRTSDNLDGFLLTTGTLLPASRAGANKGVTPGNATTYIFTLPEGESLLTVSLQWALALAAVFTIEVCNAPPLEGGLGQAQPDVSDFASTPEWVPYNTAAGATFAAATGASNTAVAVTVTAGAAAAGQAIINLAEIGFRRVRLKAVVTTGALFRVSVNGKRASV